MQTQLLRATIAAAMTLLMAIIWCLTHRYMGFSHDAQVYAVQALAKVEPHLAGDLFFQHTSQDQFTVFSKIYAAFIGVFGLAHTAVTLTVLFTIWFYAAGWALARSLFGRELAWLALVTPLITVGEYGAFKVFHYSEEFLTARLPAEAFIVTALACHFGGRRALGLAFAVAAMFVHPLIAFPGLLLIVCLWLPLNVTAWGAVIGCLGTLGISLLATVSPSVGQLLKVMDPAWSAVVIERSEFLFPQYWPTSDWLLNLRGFLCLGVTATLAQNARARRLCIVAAIIAAAGMFVACVGSLVGPIGILMQGQAWRWMWIGTFVSVLLLLPTAVTLWREQTCGRICAILLVAAWTFSPTDGTAFAGLALVLWLVRGRISPKTAGLLRWAAMLLAIVIVGWIAGNIWTLTTSSFDTGREARLIQWLRNVAGLQIPFVLVTLAGWYGLKKCRTAWVPGLSAAALLAALVLLIQPTFTEIGKIVYTAKDETFVDWQSKIPPTSTVFILRQGDTGTFAWLTLHRTNYLSMDQSAGMVFSRETSMEVKRRSEVLLPVKDADWKIHSFIIWQKAWTRANPGKDMPPRIRPLTAEKLEGLCKDPVLGFVIAKEYVGFDAVRHTQRGAWTNWNLYDCNVVRARSTAT